MSAFGIPNSEAGQGNGLVLGSDDRLEALAWALRQAETWSDLNDIRRGAPFRALVRVANGTAQRAAMMFQARWREIEARDHARSTQAILAGQSPGWHRCRTATANMPPQEN